MLRSLLEEYKKITDEIFCEVSGNCDVEDLLDKRQKIIESLFENFNKDSIKNEYLGLGLKGLDDNLYDAMAKEKNKVKSELLKLKKVRAARQCYEQNIRKNNFFNEKV
ncbi:hypothetical protein Q6375_11185 [Clostridium septicum]|uniref:hypothetical protein n=1 Tax=Clostridium septicum TaxID=1504 RepID=UPI00272E2510|nr:hypothetical protein [Clostridium septicum]WLF68546.1 hypothetical protein Q6375_11185 [Clostridium septicum]